MQRVAQSVLFLGFIVALGSGEFSRALTVGSTVSPSIESFTTFPAADSASGVNPNRIQGFAWMKNGFELEDSSTTCTYDGIFPVRGSIALKGGSFRLTSELSFDNDSTLVSFGNIVGNSHTLELCPSMTWLACNTFNGTLRDLTLLMSTDLTLSGTLNINGTVSIVGNGNTLSIPAGSLVRVLSGATLKLYGVRIDGVVGQRLRCVDDTGQMHFADTKLSMSGGTFTFASGAFKVLDFCELDETGTFLYSSGRTSTIVSEGELRIGRGITFQAGRKTYGSGIEPIFFEDNSSTIRLDGCTFASTSSGLTVKTGTFVFVNDVTLDIDSIAQDFGVTIGDGVAADDVRFYFAPGATLNVPRGHITFDLVDPTLLQSRSPITNLTRGADNKMFTNQNIVLSNLTIDTDSSAQLTVTAGKTLSYVNCILELQGSAFEITGTRYSAVTNLLAGSGEIFMRRGDLPLATLVAGTGNVIRGQGDISGTIFLTSSNSVLTAGLDGLIKTDVTLNGGNVVLSRDFAFKDDKSFITTGSIYLASHDLVLGSLDHLWTASCYIQGGGSIRLNAEMDLFSTITIKGTVVFNGGGNALNLQQTGVIIVDAGSRLVFRNMTVNGVRGSNIRCIDNDGSIILENARWIQDADFSFTKGSLSFSEQNVLAGAYTFTYDSTNTSTILSNSSLFLGGDLRLRIGRHDGIDGAEPLAFASRSSQLIFGTATFNVTSSGMSILKGTVVMQHDATVAIESDSLLNAITFGDGTADNDGMVLWLPGARTTHAQGHFMYDNVSPLGLRQRGQTGKIKQEANTTFFMNSDVFLGGMWLEADPLGVMLLAPGKVLTHNNTHISFLGGEFDITGIKTSPTAYTLAGDGLLSLDHGPYYPLTFISGQNNLITGNGDAVNPIVFTDQNAQLRLDFGGKLISDVVLNGGTALLEGDLAFASDAAFTGSGNIDLGTYVLDFGHREKTLTSTVVWTGQSGATIALNAPTYLSGTWSFSGDCMIDGERSNYFVLMPGAEIVVQPNSILNIRRAHVFGITGTNLRCLDDTGKIILDGTTFYLEDAWTLTMGALIFWNDCVFDGLESSGALFYQSSKTSTIGSGGMLSLVKNFKFTYDPPIPQNNLLVLEDVTSRLVLDDATLYLTSTGLQLTAGVLYFQDQATFESASWDGWIKCGDGVSAANDCQVLFAPGVYLSIRTAEFFYANVSPQSLSVRDQNAIHVFTSASLTAITSMLDTRLQLIFENNARLRRSATATIACPTTVLGSLIYELV